MQDKIGHAGVMQCSNGKSWRAAINIDGKNTLKYFKTYEEALKQRLEWEAEKELFLSALPTERDDTDYSSIDLKTFKFEPCARKEIKNFVEVHHYSKNISGVITDYCFKLTHNGTVVAAMIFGRMAMLNQWARYVNSPEKLIELRRLVCVDKTKKNIESFFIGKALRWLEKNTDIEVVVSYADNTHGHSGIIYKASNFKHVGQSAKVKTIEYNGESYHNRNIGLKYNGELKKLTKELMVALENGDAKWVDGEPKEIYVYELSKKKRR